MKTEDIMLYLCIKYPISSELSKARLTKMVYLADWESCIKTGKQLSKIKWYFHNFGPYVDDVIDVAKKSKYIDVVETTNIYGDKKELISAKSDARLPEVSDLSSSILDYVINQTKSMYWNDFIKHVYSTPPVANSERHTELNLERIARKATKK